MKGKKLQVFVSSTFTDLVEERQAAVSAILSAGHIPAGMELFTAGDESQMTVIKRWIDESDIYLLILGGRYGSIESVSGKSYTHLEFEYAVAQKKPFFVVVITEAALETKVKAHGLEMCERLEPKKLAGFRDTVTSSNIVKFWADVKDIKISIHETLHELSFREDLTGWVRGDQVVNPALLAEEIAALSKENSELRNKLSEIESKADITYSGVSFEKLREIFKSIEVVSRTKTVSLYEGLLAIGEYFSVGTYSMKNIIDNAGLKSLLTYNIVIRELNNNTYFYRFTESGHKFYIRALIESQENN